MLASSTDVGTTGTSKSVEIKLSNTASANDFDAGTTDNSFIGQRFSSAFRRVKYKTSAQSTSGALVKISNLNLKLDAKIKNDTGVGTANATDSKIVNGVTKQGTTVNFNVDFVDVQGIAVTPNATSAVIAVVDFQDIINPESFRVLLYDTNGARVSGEFTWQCRGT